MRNIDDLQINIVPYKNTKNKPGFDLDRIIYDLDTKIDSFSSQADTLDYYCLSAVEYCVGCSKRESG